eukprot:768739-Hanusia_phi.AAC.1
MGAAHLMLVLLLMLLGRQTYAAVTSADRLITACPVGTYASTGNMQYYEYMCGASGTTTCTAVMTGAWTTSTAANALDGYYGELAYESFTCTESPCTNQYWKIDLGESRDIQQVLAWDRSDCCIDESGSNIYIGDDSTTYTNNAYCANVAFTALSQQLTLSCNLRGRYLWFSQPAVNRLSLAEVSVQGCIRCPSGYTTVSNGSTSSDDCILAIENEQADCAVGTFSSDGKGAFINSYATLAHLLAAKPPWGIYHAESWDSATNTLPDSYGAQSAATTTGTITPGSASGNGAAANVCYIGGGASTPDTISFPNGSIPATFTLCSITRYTGGILGRILQGTTVDLLHGHHGGKTGVAHYGRWQTQSIYNEGMQTEWLVMCGSNGGSEPGNIKIAFINQGFVIRNVGNATGGTGNDRMQINAGFEAAQISDFQFSQLYVWDQSLSQTDMDTVMYALMSYLAFGNDLRAVETVYNPSYFVNNGCTVCPIGYFAVMTGSSACAMCPGDYTNLAAGSSTLNDCQCPIGSYGTGNNMCRAYPNLPYHITTAYDVTTVFGTSGTKGVGLDQLDTVNTIVLSPTDERYGYTCDSSGSQFVKLDLFTKTKVYTCGLNGNQQSIVVMPDEQTAYTRGDGNGLIAKYTLTASSCSYETYAGTGSTDGWSTATTYARLGMPIGNEGQGMVLMNDQMTLLFSDNTLNVIWQLNAATETGSVLFSNAPSGCSLTGLALSHDNSILYFTCRLLGSVYMIYMNDLTTAKLVAGTGSSGVFSDGYGALIRFRDPVDLYMSPVSNQLFVSDSDANHITIIDIDNDFFCRNLVGVVGTSEKLDNAVGTTAQIEGPRRICITRNGSVAYFADQLDYTIRTFKLNYTCGVGFYDDGTGTGTCQPCEVGYYTNSSGRRSCTACPGQSTTSQIGSSICCSTYSYYKAILESRKNCCECPPE